MAESLAGRLLILCSGWIVVLPFIITGTYLYAIAVPKYFSCVCNNLQIDA